MSDEQEIRVEVGKPFTLPSGVVVRQVVHTNVELSAVLRAVLQMQESLDELASDIRRALLMVQVEEKKQ